jgi:HPr kinase/phosphorylase
LPHDPSTVTIEQFYTHHASALQLKLIAGASGLHRRIREVTVNRPGLALTGFFKYFANKRIQVIGSAEITYLKSLPKDTLRKRIRALLDKDIPCLIFSRSINPPQIILEEAEQTDTPVFKCPLITMQLINKATLFLDVEFAPKCIEHGTTIDILGIGVLIKGASGVGKSECALALIERGHSLVADDVTCCYLLDGRELMGTAPETTRHHMEVRGLGIIDVGAIFGVGSIRKEKRIDLVVHLKDWHEVTEIDRIGLDQEWHKVLGLRLPLVTIPVRPGRDIARLVEVAALDQKLKGMGHNSAKEFNERLIRAMQTPTTAGSAGGRR